MPYQDPTQAEKDWFKANKDRFNDTKSEASPDVSQALSAENTAIKIAEHNCPPGSATKKVEIWFKFRLVRWAAAEATDGSGMIRIESVDPDPTADKKLTYKYIVMFDVAALQPQENDKLGKWQNTALFFHEMQHLQASIDRAKQPNWSGWTEACRCNKPNLDFIGQGINTSEREHAHIHPACDEYFRKAVEKKEGVRTEVIRLVGTAGQKDAQGKRPFTKKVTVPENMREKEKISVTLFWNGEVENDPQAEWNAEGTEVTVTGKLKDDKDGEITVVFDPPAIAAVVLIEIQIPRPPLPQGLSIRVALTAALVAGILLLIVWALWKVLIQP